MPVDTKHPEYQRMAAKWKTMRDAASGQEAIHCAKPIPSSLRGTIGTVTVSQPVGYIESPGTYTATSGGEGDTRMTSWPGEAYLPRLFRESWANYIARRNRAGFFNATWRTIAGLAGMLFRIAPVVKVSAVTEPMLDDVTKDGTDLDTLALLVGLEDLTVGRVGVMVDYPRSTPTDAPKTVADVERENLRPQMALFKAEQIINWATSWLNNKTVLSLVVLQEEITLPGEDEFSPECETQWRVLDLAPAVNTANEPIGHVYRVRVFRKEEYTEGTVKKVRDQLVDEFLPLMNGSPLPFIPFQFIGVDDTTPHVAEPPLMDLAYTNISHYQTTADLEHGAHKTSLPQPWVTGVNATVNENGEPVDAEFYMGGGDAWVFPNADAAVGMLEYTGQGLTALEARREAKENQMAVLGARMLEDQKSGVEAAQTAGIHRSGEQATLSSQGRTISQGLQTALGWFDEWAGGNGEVEFRLNNDFLPVPMDAQKLTALVGAWQSGAISKEALFDNLKKGEILRDSADFEDEETKIANQPPALSTGTPPTPAPAPAPAPTPAA